MNFYDMASLQPQEKTALVHEGESFTYADLCTIAAERSKEISGERIFAVRQKKILHQLVDFLAAQHSGRIPVIVPEDFKGPLPQAEIPEGACVAVMTSGSKGINKIYFRTFESWHGMFPIQNGVFGISFSTRIFCNGSLAFTGNLNKYMAVLSCGGTIIAENGFDFQKWQRIIEANSCNAIYLIPSKLMRLCKRWNGIFPEMKTIVAGSQSLGLEEIALLKEKFPGCSVTLYYGATETNYLTYVKDTDMNGDKSLIGKPFDRVEVFIEDGMIFARTPFTVMGIDQPCTVKDTGHFDDEGNLYFDGRRDDIVNINGRKISLALIELNLKKISGVSDATVKFTTRDGKAVIEAFAETSCLKAEEISSILKKSLPPHQRPHAVTVMDELPKNESGKVRV